MRAALQQYIAQRTVALQAQQVAQFVPQPSFSIGEHLERMAQMAHLGGRMAELGDLVEWLSQQEQQESG
ncbi:MAG: hypothetical protein AB7U23_10010 [Dehalococcoidia bacterium]